MVPNSPQGSQVVNFGPKWPKGVPNSQKRKCASSPLIWPTVLQSLLSLPLLGTGAAVALPGRRETSRGQPATRPPSPPPSPPPPPPSPSPWLPWWRRQKRNAHTPARGANCPARGTLPLVQGWGGARSPWTPPALLPPWRTSGRASPWTTPGRSWWPLPTCTPPGRRWPHPPPPTHAGTALPPSPPTTSVGTPPVITQ